MRDVIASRRHFLRLAAGSAAIALAPRWLTAQGQISSASNVAMDDDRYRPVKRPARTGRPSLSSIERDDLEHRLHCQCGCNLDVFTCRTTDFSCGVSPAMHADVMELVRGGYSAQEILDAFTAVYGERVLMAPTRSGFNWAAYLLPFAVLGGGTIVAGGLLRRWSRQARSRPPAGRASAVATPDELARVAAAVREDA
ncbi:MAG: cytochrome c-type biogenesis protein [Gemmatimonadaceae bacterium]